MRYEIIVIDGEQIFLSVDSITVSVLMLQAHAGLLSRPQVADLAQTIPQAKYYLGMDLLETSSEPSVEQRGVRLVMESASEGYPPAIYTLGAFRDFGDFVPENKREAMHLFRQAAELGHARSMWVYGIALIYGAPGVVVDWQLGTRIVLAAARLKFTEALESLARWHDVGEFGFARDINAAAQFRELKSDPAAIKYTR